MNDVELRNGSFFYNLIFWLRKLQAGFIALVLVLVAIFIYQYWQDTNQPPLILAARFKNDSMVITLDMPERLLPSNKGLASNFKVTTSSMGNSISDQEVITIDSSSTNPNLDFEPKQIILSKTELQKNETSQIIKLTSITNLDEQDVDVIISISSSSGSQVSFEKTIPVENKMNNPYVITLAFLSFFSAILSFIMQIRSFRSK